MKKLRILKLFCVFISLGMSTFLTILLINMHHGKYSISLVELYQASSKMEKVPALSALYLVVVFSLACTNYLILIFELIFFLPAKNSAPAPAIDSTEKKMQKVTK